MSKLMSGLVAAMLAVMPATVLANPAGANSAPDRSAEPADGPAPDIGADQKPRADWPGQDQETDTFAWTSSQGRLGIMVIGLTPELRVFFGAPRDAGLLVARVEQGSPADRAGIRVGDILTAIGNAKIAGPTDVLMATANARRGERLTIELIRNQRRITVQAELGPAPTSQDPI